MSLKAGQTADRERGLVVSARNTAKIKRILKEHASDGDSFGFVFPDGEHVSVWDTHAIAQREVKRRLAPNSGIHYAELLLHYGCARIGQTDNTVYVETKHALTGKAEETVLDAIYAKRNVGRILVDGGAHGRALKRKLDNDLPHCEVIDTEIKNTYKWWCDEDDARASSM